MWLLEMANSKITKFVDKKGNSYSYLFIDDRSGVFYVRKRVGDRTFSVSLETTDFNTARRLVLEKVAELSKQTDIVPRKNKIFKDFYDIMIEEKLAGDTKAATLNRIDIVWRKSLEPFWAFILPEDINQDLVTEFITWHKRKRPGVQLINVFKYLGNVLNTMVERGALPVTQKPRLDLPKDEIKHHAKQKGRYLSDDEVSKILKHADSRTWLMVSIGFCTGMRKMEIGALEVARLKKVKSRFIISLDTDDTKTGLAREIPLPEYLTEPIERQISPKSSFLFPMATDSKRHISPQVLDKGWVEAKAAANVKGRLRFHDLRHTCASNCAKSNINPVVAVTMLGMSLVTYQKTYLKLTPEDLIIASETNAARLRDLK